MAESVVSFLLAKLDDLVAHEAGFLLGVNEEIKVLERKLRWIHSFLKDADRKSKDNEVVKFWVSQVRDVAYDAEDVIDAFILQGQRERPQHQAFIGLVTKIIRPATQLKSLRKFSQQIKEIKGRIEEISASKSEYCVGVTQAGEASSSTSSSTSRSWKQMRPGSIEEEDVVGIEDDVKLLVHRLTRGEKRRAVVSIVGMGGLGKTTLANKVYGNAHVKRHFQCLAWISISQEFDVKALLQRVMKEVMPFVKDGMVKRMDVHDLRSMLAEHLKVRRYLIVMDDIWKREGWDALVPAFPNEMKGSRVMLTTRNKDIALYADAQSAPYELQFLPDDECWELFCKKAFPGNVEANCPPKLENLGRDIVAKCDGLPLAIVVLGGMLSGREKVPSEWEKVYKSVSWQFREGHVEISGIFYLSYHDLPYYLKSCFLYCGVFPEDAEISARKLIKLWIAEGFVQARGTETLEEVAEDFLAELIQRSMIQVAKKSSNGQVKACRIHDVLRELAISEAKGKLYDLMKDDESLPHMVVRRLVVYHDSSKPSLSYSHLRSFLRFAKDGDLQKNYFKKFLNSPTILRVLDLEGVCLAQLPKQIGKLAHLRYLGLRKTGLKDLQYSIGNLFNLQTLDIRETQCKSLPKELLKNQSMRHLCIGKCSFQVSKVVCEFPIDLPHVELRNLGNLETLTGIVAGRWIDSLETLTNLRRLGIGRVSNVDVTGLASSLSKLTSLHSLWLEGEAIPSLELAKHCNLYKMYLLGCIKWLPKVEKFPPYLSKLFLEDSGLKRDPFPVLMELPKLKILGLLRGAYSENKMHSLKGGFLELEELVIQLNEIEYWEIDVGAMPSLVTMSLIQCERLKMLPEGMASMTSLQNLNLLAMPYRITSELSEASRGSEFYKIEHVRSLNIRENIEN